MADPGGVGGQFLGQTEARRAEKKKGFWRPPTRGGHRKTGANLHEISKMAAVSEQWCISTRIFLILVILSTSANVHGWDSIDLELFDLVEEVKDNFYGVLGLKQVSTVVYFYFGWF